MINQLLRILPLLALLAGNLPVCSQSIIVGTYNVRMQTPADTGNLWVDRAPVVTSLIRFHRFDILGTQEAFRNQLDDIKQALPEYEYYGAGRDDGQMKGEHSAIFFRRERFELLDKGDFWLSPTPEKPSKGWDGTCCNRLCTWIRLKDKSTSREFFVFNAHYDHEGQQARLESSKLILRRMISIAGRNDVIFTGDLNCPQQSEPYLQITQSKLVSDCFQKASIRYAANGTFNGFGKTIASSEIIDHIFISPRIDVLRYGILSDTYHGKYPSDHFPVLAELRWN